jgi:AraC-like DNA-binding protein
MKSQEFNNRPYRNSALQSGNGELWFLTKKGISIVNPDRIRINKNPPPVVIESVYFDQLFIPLHQEPGAYQFKGIRSFRFHFTAPTFLSPEKIKFRYRLEGFENDWIFLAPGRGRVVHYWNLEPGTYTFKVMACNAEGLWNPAGDSMTFILKPFFYQTVPFQLGMLILAAVLAVGAAFYIYKKRPFTRKEKYKGSSLNPVFVDECIKKLKHLMENQKVYRDEKISLPSLAEKLSLAVKSTVGPHQLSQMLNEKLNRNFPDFINYYRIEEAREILASRKGGEKKISVIAGDVGFNSMTAFYRTFKKYTGMTPNQYKEEVKKRK